MRLIFALLLSLLATTAIAADKPDWDHPRKLVLQLNSDDPAKVSLVLNNAINTVNHYGQDNVKVAIVAYGPGLKAVLKATAPAADRVTSLQFYSVEFLACGNTMETMKKTNADLLPGVAVVKAGIPELIERQLDGWIYIAP